MTGDRKGLMKIFLNWCKLSGADSMQAIKSISADCIKVIWAETGNRVLPGKNHKSIWQL